MNVIFKLLAYALLSLHASAWAQGWTPQRPIEIVVGYAPGGGVDRTARALDRLLTGNKLANSGVAVINKPGGNTTIAYHYLSQRPADGHTVMVYGQTIFTTHITGASALTYTDFTPVASLFSEYHVYVVAANTPVRSGKDLIARMKQDVRQVSTGVSAIGSPGHLSVGLLNKALGGSARDLRIIAFKGSAEALTNVLGGHIELTPAPASLAAPHVGSEKLRAVAVAAPKRMGGPFAAIPTWREQGVDLVYGPWRGILAPKGLPAAQLAWWEASLRKIADTAEWKSDMEKIFAVDDFVTGAQLRKDMEKEYAETRAVLVELGMAK
ncbi:MAG: tripartite tricarboxylate transporter substrate binding protein [Betaproteobacteria bacterium]|nr:tripartite tricarboxylate transporter substrate binding protein [Betaproteobacteria bacterium]